MRLTPPHASVLQASSSALLAGSEVQQIVAFVHLHAAIMMQVSKGHGVQRSLGTCTSRKGEREKEYTGL